MLRAIWLDARAHAPKHCVKVSGAIIWLAINQVSNAHKMIARREESIQSSDGGDDGGGFVCAIV